jgi:D-alanyl-lipoteichoic acid acyltransferase DltB (MBOAT superfamily)
LFLFSVSPLSLLYIGLLTFATFFAIRAAGPKGQISVALIFPIIGLLAYYKITDSVSPEEAVQSAIIPLGLSYYSFRSIHYILERYKGTLAEHGFREYLFYMLFLPTIVVGPIHRFPDFHRDLRRHRWDERMLSEGLERILYGYVKITVLGNYLMSRQFAAFIGTLDPENLPLIYYLEIIRGALNLYFQFSGYSDIAIGFGMLLGFRVMENFRWPFLQKNVSDFWSSWHISLTSWCRDYVYGTVISTTRSAICGAVVTMFIIAMWHEVSLRYFAWAIYHGVGIFVWQRFQKFKPSLPKIDNRFANLGLRFLSIAFTAHFIAFGFTIVRQQSLKDSWKVLTTVLFSWI